MSFCRLSNAPEKGGPYHAESELYVFKHIDGFWLCAGCKMQDGEQDFRAASAAEMVEHVKAHRVRGHKVWDGVEAALAKNQILCEADKEVFDFNRPARPISVDQFLEIAKANPDELGHGPLVVTDDAGFFQRLGQ